MKEIVDFSTTKEKVPSYIKSFDPHLFLKLKKLFFEGCIAIYNLL